MGLEKCMRLPRVRILVMKRQALRKILGKQHYEVNKTKRMCQITYGKKTRRRRNAVSSNKKTLKSNRYHKEIKLYSAVGLYNIYCEATLLLWVKFPLKCIRNVIRKLFFVPKILKTILLIFEKTDCRICTIC